MRDYLAGAGAARRFYRGTPDDPAAFEARLAEVRARFGPDDRERAARALHPTSDRARARLDRFVREGGAVVTTGQQAGLLGGPLYTVYKALSVVRLAAALEERFGVVVLPVFWVASEDHDWAEVNHADLLDGDRGVRRVGFAGADARPLPMSARTLPDDLSRFLDEAAQVLSGQEHTDHYIKLIRDSYSGGRTVSDAFTRLVSELLAPFDMVLTDAADPALKAASVPVLAEAISRIDELDAALRARDAELEEAGYQSQVAVVPGATPLFHIDGSGRERLDRRPGGFRMHDSGREIGGAEALEALRRSPERFSPNALLRPVVESAVFPTLAYVAGPGEIAYFAQSAALFATLGIAPPVVVPRGSATLVEPSVRELLERLDLTEEDLMVPAHELAAALARRATPAPVARAVDRIATDLVEGYRALIEAAAEIDPTLAGPLGGGRNRSLAEVRTAERQVLRAIKRRDRVVLAQAERARAHLAPGGKPQERVLGVLPFLARYGPNLLFEIARRMEPASGAVAPERSGAGASGSG